jgi:16S rRNA processing protein RimM
VSTHLEVGYIARAHGMVGEVVVKTFDPASEVLMSVDRLWVRAKDGTARELELKEVGQQNKDLRVSFKGVHRRELAEAMVGSTVSVFREDLEAPEVGEYFQGDLVGLEARTPEGVRLGIIEEIWNTGPVPNLVIRDGSTEYIVPFAQEFVPKVDLEVKVATVIPLEYSE